MPRTTPIGRLRAILKKASIYDPRLEPQIALTVRLEQLLEKLHGKLESVRIVDVEIQGNGTERQTVHPLVQQILKLENQLQDSYTALGLNYNAKSSNIRETVATGTEEASPLDTFLSRIQQ